MVNRLEDLAIMVGPRCVTIIGDGSQFDSTQWEELQQAVDLNIIRELWVRACLMSDIDPGSKYASMLYKQIMTTKQ